MRSRSIHTHTLFSMWTVSQILQNYRSSEVLEKRLPLPNKLKRCVQSRFDMRGYNHMLQVTQVWCCVVCSVSKQHAVIPSQVFELEDGSSSYKDFAMTRNNRFSSAGQASKNIIQPPSAVLHYYNVPPCISQDHLLRVCDILI